MIHSLTDITTTALSLALEAAAGRQQVAGANVANAAVEGYAPQRLSFEDRLTEARASLARGGAIEWRDLQDVRPERVPVHDEGQASMPVQLDAELAEMARNAVHYQVLVQGLSRHLGLLALAVADGRR